jgi:hypothetical protein
VEALLSNTTGNFNTATGQGALESNTTGSDNTATGFDALLVNAAAGNTATGAMALEDNTTGNLNTATGQNALLDNTTGGANTATGASALKVNTTGGANTADGRFALGANTTGSDNTALGFLALGANKTGIGNTALGFEAGLALTTGNNNIDIANLGKAGDKQTIRIGRQGIQTAAFIAGISGVPVSGAAVEVSSIGQLGIVMSSARFKRDIHDMGAASLGLMKLRPVTFRYQDDSQAVQQYGLVAEEVQRVYPELVTRSADGKVESVRYLTLTAMLLNEVQRQNRANARQAEQINRQATQIKELTAHMAEARANYQRQLGTLRSAVEARLAALEQATHAKNTEAKLAAAFVGQR